MMAGVNTRLEDLATVIIFVMMMIIGDYDGDGGGGGDGDGDGDGIVFFPSPFILRLLFRRHSFLTPRPGDLSSRGCGVGATGQHMVSALFLTCHI